nr:MAG TPA: cell division protein [Caudoviricetes sp.]
MSTEIIVAILALVGTLAGSYFSNNKNTAVINEKIKDLKEDIQILSNRVDRHNNLVERMAIVEEHIKMSDKNKNDKEGD